MLANTLTTPITSQLRNLKTLMGSVLRKFLKEYSRDISPLKNKFKGPSKSRKQCLP